MATTQQWVTVFGKRFETNSLFWGVLLGFALCILPFVSDFLLGSDGIITKARNWFSETFGGTGSDSKKK